MQDKILLIEDDKKLTQLLSLYLNRNGFEVAVGHSGLETEQLLKEHSPTLLILDLMLPGMDGLSVCREIRGSYSGKILILTASDDDMDQVAALEMGADDYVCKPIQPRVLLARIRMLLRRKELPDADNTQHSAAIKKQDANLSQLGSLSLNKLTQRILLNDQLVNLTPSEFDLLWILVAHADQVLTRERLVKLTRGIDYDGIDRTIDNKIVLLRKKLNDDPALPKRIITLRGKGYLLVSSEW
ncbi:response regulator [Candidatus Halocynthiibacter alkanivorans]|uniref:response regulator n=1 Tax=Candidatus Halocynthiibacter alkanivorans TaxID=2267619 RepID=UPI000DF1678B|nr:response regulator [Candidatus Halocynthiibacter alkanivorans]